MSHIAAAGSSATLLVGQQATAVCTAWIVSDHLQRAAAYRQDVQRSRNHSIAQWHPPGSSPLPLLSKDCWFECPGVGCITSEMICTHHAVPRVPASACNPSPPFIFISRQGASCRNLALRPGESGSRALHTFLSLLSRTHCRTLLCERLLQTSVQGSLGSICSKGICSKGSFPAHEVILAAGVLPACTC